MYSFSALMSEVARFLSIDMRCSVVLPNLRCAFKCLITVYEVWTVLAVWEVFLDFLDFQDFLD
jgi:hypothetical protein